MDFLPAHGLIVFWTQALWFRLLGFTYATHLIGAAAANLVAAVSAIILARSVLPTSRWLPPLAGLITAVWFYPPFGAPYSEQTSFLFSFVSLALVILATDERALPPLRRSILLLLAGIGAFLALLGKQNAGLLFLPVYAVVLWVRTRRRPGRLVGWSAWLVGGITLGAIGFTLWLVTVSDPRAFFESYFVVPSGSLVPRLVKDLPQSLLKPLLGKGRGLARYSLLVFLLVSLVFVVRRRKFIRGTAAERPAFDAAFFCLSLGLFQNFFNLSSNNAAENGYPFAGLITVFGLATASMLIDPSFPRIGRRVRVAVGTFLVLLLIERGLEVGWYRRVHNVFQGARFTEQIGIAGWEALRWPQEMKLGVSTLEAADLWTLVDHLRQRADPFFVFPDFTFLYAALGQPSPQPILWFHRGLTYPELYDVSLDRRIVDSLVQSGVETVVLERYSFLGPLEERMDDFPLLREFLSERFQEVTQFGPFLVLHRQGAADPIGATEPPLPEIPVDAGGLMDPPRQTTLSLSDSP